MSVSPEAATTMENLPAVLSNQPDSGNRELGQETCLSRYQLDYTCGFVATSFAALVDVIASRSLGKGDEM